MIRSKRYHDKKQSNLGSSNVPDQVWEALAMVNKHEFVAEVVYTRGNNMPPSIICYSQMQMEDMKLHCENDPDSILGIDRTFNLGPTYVTNFVYKNKKVVKKSSRDHPIFVGPVFFHWDASYYTYHSFLSHVKARLDADVKYIDIRIGSDDEGGITKAIDKVFNTSERLLPIVDKLIAIKKELISSEVYELAPPDKTEMVWAKVDIVGSKTLYLSSFYNPKTSDETSLKNFDFMIRKATQIKNSTLIIGGDFNLPGWDWNNKSLKPNTSYPHLHYFFGNSLDDTCLTQIVDVPTRKDNILDLIITNLPNQVQRVEVIPGLSDHDIVFAEFAIAPSKLKQKPRIIPLYKKANWGTIKQEINTLYKHLSENQQHLCVNEMWNCFKTTITKAVKDHIPHKTAKTKDGHPWVTMETKRLIRKRDRLYKKSKKSGNTSIAKKYKEVKHQVQKSIRKSYWEYIESIILPPQDETNFGTMKKFWTYIKHKKTDYSGITEIKQDGKLLTEN
ncbi:unnamed protein product [Mytilus edulis]|uniref:Endonuclease/exonuclease/phosphatase domain-containing protein n=1 Tax=Mytilus edulis TaxID=6550 RepID=A0A8S3UP79_MYTED|nr:unnamed protein product [Mytilus edulis]